MPRPEHAAVGRPVETHTGEPRGVRSKKGSCGPHGGRLWRAFCVLDTMADASMKHLPSCLHHSLSGSHRRASNPAWTLGDRCIKEVFLKEVVPELSLAGQMGVNQERMLQRKFLSGCPWPLVFPTPSPSFTINQAPRGPTCLGEVPTMPLTLIPVSQPLLPAPTLFSGPCLRQCPQTSFVRPFSRIN